MSLLSVIRNTDIYPVNTSDHRVVKEARQMPEICLKCPNTMAYLDKMNEKEQDLSSDME